MAGTQRNSGIIDVLIAVDAMTILQNYPNSNDPNNPRGVDGQYVYMTTRRDAFSAVPAAN